MIMNRKEKLKLFTYMVFGTGLLLFNGLKISASEKYIIDPFESAEEIESAEETRFEINDNQELADDLNSLSNEQRNDGNTDEILTGPIDETEYTPANVMTEESEDSVLNNQQETETGKCPECGLDSESLISPWDEAVGTGEEDLIPNAAEPSGDPNYSSTLENNTLFIYKNGTLYDTVLISSLNMPQWIHDKDGNAYYLKDGMITRDQILTIAGKGYCFDIAGIMIRNAELEYSFCYEGEKTVSGYINADWDGTLLKNSWYESPTGQKYFFGENYFACDGYHTIDGVSYYFNYAMVTNETVEVNGSLISFGFDGRQISCTSIPEKGWFQVDRKWYYSQNRTLVTGKREIDGKAYFFYSNGQMLEDEETHYFYSTEYGYWTSGYIRASASGALLKNSWYESPDGTWMYYGDDYLKYCGYHSIDGKSYYFTPVMAARKFVEIQGILKYFDGDGIETESRTIPASGWLWLNRSWFYSENNSLLKNCISEIDGIKYGFASDGKMYAGESFSFDSGIYRAKADGSLFKNEIYTAAGKSLESGCEYYDENCRKQEGYQTYNGNQYYFNHSGIEVNSLVLLDSKWAAYFGSDGRQMGAKIPYYNNSWLLAQNNWYYVENYQLKVSDILTLKTENGKEQKYGFDQNGIMVKNTLYIDRNNSFSEQKEMDNFICYYFGSDGLAKTGWVYVNSSTNHFFGFRYSQSESEEREDFLQYGWYYFGREYESLNGLQRINNIDYYFCDGYMITNREVVVRKGNEYYLYTVNENGAAADKTKTLRDGFYKDYYVKNRKLLSGWQWINGFWYYFFPFEDGTRCFGQLPSALGAAVKNGEYEINGASYYFNSQGKMLTGWIKTDEGWMYANSDGSLFSDGSKKINDKEYWFESFIMRTGVLETGKSIILTDDSGAKITDVVSDGWVKDHIDNWYYVKSGNLVRSQVLNLFNSREYAFDRNGIMLVNTVFSNRYFGADGLAVKDQIIQLKTEEEYNKTIILNKNGSIVTGWYEKNGSWYYSPSSAQGIYKEGSFIIDDKIYTFDQDGKSNRIAADYKEGWNLIDGNYYFVENGSLVKDQIRTIHGKEYLFYSDGTMAYSTLYYCSGFDSTGSSFDNGEKIAFCFDKTGALVKNGWAQIGSDWYYAQGDGKLVSGLITVNGRKYYLSDRFKMKSCFAYDFQLGCIYETNDSGAITEEYKPGKNGWVYTQTGAWLFVDNGTFIRNGFCTINGKEYCFNEDGVMLGNTLTIHGYAASSGDIQTDYYDHFVCFENGKQVYGYKNINGNHYWYDKYVYVYCDDSSGSYDFSQEMLKEKNCFSGGFHIVDGVWYYFTGKGDRIALTPDTGWVEVDGKWYYFEKGIPEIFSGSKVINGKLYYFHSNRMLENSFHAGSPVVYSHQIYYSDKNGQSNAGWVSTGNFTFYFDEDGLPLTGFRIIDGKYCIFTHRGVLQ